MPELLSKLIANPETTASLPANKLSSSIDERLTCRQNAAILRFFTYVYMKAKNAQKRGVDINRVDPVGLNRVNLRY